MAHGVPIEYVLPGVFGPKGCNYEFDKDVYTCRACGQEYTGEFLASIGYAGSWSCKELVIHHLLHKMNGWA